MDSELQSRKPESGLDPRRGCFIRIQQILVAIVRDKLFSDYDTCYLLLAGTIRKHHAGFRTFKMTKKAPERPAGVGFCTHNRGGGRRCGRETDYKPDGMSRFSVSILIAQTSKCHMLTNGCRSGVSGASRAGNSEKQKKKRSGGKASSTAET